MAITLVQVGQAIRAGLINQVIKQVNAIALNGIVPTSVEGTNVVVTPNGQITFTGATNVSVNGVFTGTYDNYRIVWNSPTRSASGSLQFHLRGGGADVGSNYGWMKGVDGGTSRSVTSSTNGNSVPLDQGANQYQTTDGYLDLYGPALARYTVGSGQSVVLDGYTVYTTTSSFGNPNPNAYDGFSMYGLTSGQTWSGTMRVYGYNNLV